MQGETVEFLSDRLIFTIWIPLKQLQVRRLLPSVSVAPLSSCLSDKLRTGSHVQQVVCNKTPHL